MVQDAVALAANVTPIKDSGMELRELEHVDESPESCAVINGGLNPQS